jgi:hypothetical protein
MQTYTHILSYRKKTVKGLDLAQKYLTVIPKKSTVGFVWQDIGRILNEKQHSS